MVKKILLLISAITILLQISCNKTFVPLTMDKKPYNGNELRTDRYYYVEEMFSRPEKMPIMKDLCGLVLDSIEYPQSAIDDTISGVVLVDFNVETNGNTSNHKVIKGVREDLNNEALRVAKLLKFDKPAYTGGKAVRTVYHLPISFLLDYDFLHLKYTPIIECSDIINEGNAPNR